MANRLRPYNLSAILGPGAREQEALAQEGAAIPSALRKIGADATEAITSRRTERESRRRFDEKMALERDEFGLRKSELLEKKAERQAAENAMLDMLDTGLGQAEQEMATLGQPSPKTVEGIKETAQALGPNAPQRYLAGPMDTVPDLDAGSLAELAQAARSRKDMAQAQMEQARRAIYSPLVRGSKKAEARAAYNHHLSLRIAAQSEEAGYSRRLKDAERRQAQQDQLALEAERARIKSVADADKAATERQERSGDVPALLKIGQQIKGLPPELLDQAVARYVEGSGERRTDWQGTIAALQGWQGATRETKDEEKEALRKQATDLQREKDTQNAADRLQARKVLAMDKARRIMAPPKGEWEAGEEARTAGHQNRLQQLAELSDEEAAMAYWGQPAGKAGEAARAMIVEARGGIPPRPEQMAPAAPAAAPAAVPVAQAPAPAAAGKAAAVAEFKALPREQQTKARWEQIKRAKCGPGG